MSYKMNYGGVAESGTFEPLPVGAYRVTIDKIEETTTKGAGLPMIKVRYKVSSGKYTGRFIFDNVVLFGKTDKGAGMTKHFLHIIDEPYDGDFDVDPDNWVGKELTVQVKIDEKYNSNKVVAREGGIPF